MSASTKKKTKKRSTAKKTQDSEKKGLLTRREFCALCAYKEKGQTYQALVVDIKRGKVVEKKIGQTFFIDPKHPLNKSYIEDKKAFYQLKYVGTAVEWKAEKERIELEKATEDLEIKKMNRAKLEGELIPTELVKIVFKTHLKEVYQQFHNAAGQIAMDTIRKFGGSKADIAEMKGELVESLNVAIEKAQRSSQQQVKQIKAEYLDAKK